MLPRVSCLSPDALDQAARSEPLAPPVQAHLDGCAQCSAAFMRRALAVSSAPGAAEETRTRTVNLEAAAAADHEEVLHRGQVLGRYVVLDKLGEGGMGAVFSAHDQELDRKVALKVLTMNDAPQGQSSQGQARLLREAQSLAKLAHPNVVGLHDVLSLDGRIVVVMELVEGQNLKSYLRARSRPQSEVLALFDAAGRGLSFAHQKGIVHRDFKPENVLVGVDGRVRVADFGIARSVSASEADAKTSTGTLSPDAPPLWKEPTERSLTQLGQVIGTPAYMAPELFRGQPASPRTDQFSFAVALYEALAGQRPFQGTLVERIAQGEQGRFAAPPSGVKLRPYVLRALTRALASQPESRFQGMEALLEALRRDPERVRRRRLALGAGVVVLLGLGITVVRGVRERAMLCSGSERELSGVWDERVRSALRPSFEATHVPYAKDALALVESGLDARRRAWVSMHREACLATRVRGVQSDEVLSLRMSCLADRASEMRALTALFVRADASMVEKSARALDALAPVGDCADLKLLLAQVRPPSSPALRQRVTALRGQLDEVAALSNTGRYRDAKARLETLQPDVDAAAYVPLMAAARLIGTRLADRLGDKDEELTASTAALNLAVAASADYTAAESAIAVMVAKIHAGDAKSGREWAAFAQAAVERIGAPPALKVRVYRTLASIQFDLEGNAPAALANIRVAVELANEKLGPNQSDTWAARDTYAIILNQLGETARSGAETEQLIADMSARLGPQHPALANPYNVLGTNRYGAGKWPAAEAAYGRALHLLDINSMQESVLYAYVEDGLAAIALTRADRLEAMRLSDRELSIIRRAAGPDYPLAAMAEAREWQIRAENGEVKEALLKLSQQMGRLEAAKDIASPAYISTAAALGRVRLLGSDAAGAVQSLEAAVAGLLKAGGAESLDGTDVHDSLGRALLAKGDAKAAAARFTVEQRMLERLGGAAHPDLGFARTGLGLSAHAAGDNVMARRELEAGLELFADRPGAWRERAEARYGLAQLLRTEDRERARKLAEFAATEVAQLGTLGRGTAKGLQAFRNQLE